MKKYDICKTCYWDEILSTGEKITNNIHFTESDELEKYTKELDKKNIKYFIQ